MTVSECIFQTILFAGLHLDHPNCRQVHNWANEANPIPKGGVSYVPTEADLSFAKSGWWRLIINSHKSHRESMLRVDCLLCEQWRHHLFPSWKGETWVYYLLRFECCCKKCKVRDKNLWSDRVSSQACDLLDVYPSHSLSCLLSSKSKKRHQVAVICDLCLGSVFFTLPIRWLKRGYSVILHKKEQKLVRRVEERWLVITKCSRLDRCGMYYLNGAVQ